MIEIKEVLRRWQAAQSLHQIARETALDYKTVRRYLGAAKFCGLARNGTLDEAEIAHVSKRVQGRPAAERTADWRAPDGQRAQIEAWLGGERPLRLGKVHTLLERKGVQVSYWTLRRYAQQELGWRKKAPTVRLADPPPGQEAQVDFGKMGMMCDAETGKRHVLWALVVTLSYSRYMFVWPTLLQTTAAVCEGLEQAWAFFGAMARTCCRTTARRWCPRRTRTSPSWWRRSPNTCRRAGFSWTQRGCAGPRTRPGSKTRYRTSARAGLQASSSGTCGKHGTMRSSGVARQPEGASTARPGACRPLCQHE